MIDLKKNFTIKNLCNDPIINEFKEHSMSLYCWFKALSEDKIKKNSFFILIDKHDDFTPISKELVEKLESIDKKNLEKVKEFIKKDCRLDNCEFIRLGMEMGIIGDCLMICEMTSNIERCEDKENYYIYTDFKGNKHKIFVVEGIRDLEESHGGLFVDDCKESTREFKKVLNLDNLSDESILIDIDLDYFSVFKGDCTYPVHKKFYSDFFSGSNLRDVISAANVINLVLEPRCCGGEENMIEIKNNLYKELKSIHYIKLND